MMYISSTMSASVVYVNYDTSRKDINTVKDTVVIKGKTGVQDKKTLTCLEGGTITAITEQQYAWLKDNPLFKLHTNNGFIKVLKSKSDAEKQADKPAEVKDNSSQLTSKDLKKRGLKKPKVDLEKATVSVEEDVEEEATENKSK